MALAFRLLRGPNFGARNFQGSVDLRLLGITGALSCVGLEPYSATQDLQGLAIALTIDVEGCCPLLFNLRHKAEAGFDTQLHSDTSSHLGPGDGRHGFVLADGFLGSLRRPSQRLAGCRLVSARSQLFVVLDASPFAWMSSRGTWDLQGLALLFPKNISLSTQVMKPEGPFTSPDATLCRAEKHSICKAKGLKKTFKSNMIYCKSYFDFCVEGEDHKFFFHEGCGIAVTIKDELLYFCLPFYRRLLKRFAKKEPDTTICSSKWFGTCIGDDDDRFIE